MKILASALSIVVLVAACGGGSGTTSTSNNPGNTATAQAVTTVGAISAFGSVFVNGVRYDISAATLSKDGVVATQGDLAVGQIAVVKGRADNNGANGKADSVEVENNVVGQIKSIDIANNKLVVLGQTVTVNSATSFSVNITPAGLAGLVAGDRVEVSGVAAANGDIAASRIEKEAGTKFQVVGAVSAVNATLHTFAINGLTVNYTTAVIDGFTTGQPANGDIVAVRGSSFDTTSTTLTATRVLPAASDVRRGAGRDALEQEGLITRFVSATDFDVAGKKVTTNTATVYRNGSASDLLLNAKVEVRGKLDTAGVLVADMIEFRRVGVLELAGTISAVDKTNSKVTVLGVDIALTATTRLEDKTSTHIQQFSINDLNSGDTVVVRGFESPATSGKITATRLERIPAIGANVFVSGPFTATTPPLFKIIGITVDSTGAMFVAGEHATLSSATFFTQAVGKVVLVKGTLSGNNVVATKIAIASHDDEADND